MRDESITIIESSTHSSHIKGATTSKQEDYHRSLVVTPSPPKQKSSSMGSSPTRSLSPSIFEVSSSKSSSSAYHFAKLCGDCTNSNHSRAKLKQVVSVEVIWQGEPIQCTKSARTRACKICMVERKQIMKALRDDKHKVINENDDIYAACKCSTRFHKFAHIDSDALRTRLTQKKVTPKRKSKKACGNRKPAPPGQENRQQTTPELVRLLESPTRLIDTNVPGLPYRSPCEHPSNLHLAQRRQWDLEQATPHPRDRCLI